MGGSADSFSEHVTTYAANDLQRRIEQRSAYQAGHFERHDVPDFSHVPGMISQAEGNYLYWLVSEEYTGRGAIVELGTWLGKSTLHLAAGLKKSGLPGRIHSFDRFRWGGWADSQKSGIELEAGADFQPHFEENIAPYRELIDVTKVDYHKLEWYGGPVEILFVDAPKNVAGFRACLKAFASGLMPGESMLVFQDYLHPPSYDLALCLAQLTGKIRLCHVVIGSGTVGFLLESGLTPQDAELRGFDPRKMNREDIEAAWDCILAPLPDEPLQRFTAGKAMHLYDVGAVDDACSIIRDVPFNKKMQEQWSFWARQPAFTVKYGPLFKLFCERFSIKGQTTI